ncbi:hypothetical protein CRG98_022660 [Punica granatum]|nr:hypothetical protein CRG98_022660 [Punica granatum]
MIKAHVKALNFEDALASYVEMLETGVEPDNFTYPALLKACAQLRTLDEGMQIHGNVIKFGLECDVYVQNSLISFYGKCKKIGSACSVFEHMEDKSVASWSAIIAAHASLGLWNECLMLFGQMNRLGFWRAEESILVSVLSACTHLGFLDSGRSTHGALLRNMPELNVIVQTSLIDMYVKCGRLDKGLSLFRNMKRKNHMSYSVMISGLAMHGRGRKALTLFSEMLEEGLKPDEAVYVGVLNACSHAGLFNEGLSFFEEMRSEHGIDPTVRHYGCVVDLLGRAGKVCEALELAKSMPIEPNEVIWRSLLSACKVYGELEIGEIAANEIFKLDPEKHNLGDYLALSHLYAQAQRWDDVARVWSEMAKRGISQKPGFSSVEVNRRTHRFVSQDMNPAQCKGVYEMIHQMEWQLKFEGYLPDTSQVSINDDEEEKRERLKGHSQKLAIAFALIHTSQGSLIRITRNVRMCSDCHTYTKYITVIYGREITVRDRNRFHHFKDGTCSCGDYW